LGPEGQAWVRAVTVHTPSCCDDFHVVLIELPFTQPGNVNVYKTACSWPGHPDHRKPDHWLWCTPSPPEEKDAAFLVFFFLKKTITTLSVQIQRMQTGFSYVCLPITTWDQIPLRSFLVPCSADAPKVTKGDHSSDFWLHS
jgi:hypothetical protein